MCLWSDCHSALSRWREQLQTVYWHYFFYCVSSYVSGYHWVLASVSHSVPVVLSWFTDCLVLVVCPFWPEDKAVESLRGIFITAVDVEFFLWIHTSCCYLFGYTNMCQYSLVVGRFTPKTKIILFEQVFWMHAVWCLPLLSIAG